MYQKHGIINFSRIRQYGHVQQGKGRCDIPSAIGAERPFVIASRGLVKSVVIPHELRGIFGQGVGNSACQGIVAITVIFRALRVQLFTHLIACRSIVRRIEVAASRNPAHVVHSNRDCGFYTGIDSSGIHRKASPAANSQNSYALRIHILAVGKVVHRSAKIFRIDVGRCHITGPAAAFSCKRGVERDGQETTFRQSLGVPPRNLLLDCTERTAHGDCRQFFAFNVQWFVQIRRQRYSVTVMKSDFAVNHFVALRENLVPFLRKIKFFFHDTVVFDTVVRGVPICSA